MRPDYIPARIALGVVMLISGQRADALRIWEDALKRDPQNKAAEMYLRMANSTQLGNDRSAAMTHARVRVRFEPSGITIELGAGERLLDAADDQHGAGLLPIACRAGNCGTCLVRVRAGAAALAPPAMQPSKPRSTQLAAASDERLGCQLHGLPTSPPRRSDAFVVVEAARR